MITLESFAQQALLDAQSVTKNETPLSLDRVLEAFSNFYQKNRSVEDIIIVLLIMDYLKRHEFLFQQTTPIKDHELLDDKLSDLPRDVHIGVKNNILRDNIY